MREMSSEMATLLKSKKMIGDNRPVHEIVLGGGGKRNLINPFEDEVVVKKVLGFNNSSIPTISNPISTTDGRFAFAYCNVTSGVVNIAYANDESFFENDYVFDSVIPAGVVITGLVPASSVSNVLSMFRRNDGKVLLFVNDLGNVTTNSGVYVYISNNGNCNDFVYYSAILTVVHTDKGIECATVNIPIQIDIGGIKRLILSFTHKWAMYEQYSRSGGYVYYSDNFGLNWSRAYALEMDMYLLATMGQPAQLKDGSIVCEVQMHSGASAYLIASTNNGSTFTLYSSFYEGVSSWFYENSYCNSFFYDALTDTLYRVAAGGGNAKFWKINSPTLEKIKNSDNWEWLADLATLRTDTSPQIIMLPSKNVAITWADSENRTIIVGLNLIEYKLQAKSISINRNNGMSSNLNVSFDNKQGILAPDREGEYNQLLWPNKEIIVRQGYGEELIQTYKGLIDTVEMSTFPQEISISARDNLKRALDQTVSSILGEHVLTFVGMQVEEMFISLASMAGIPLGVVEITGIAVAEKTFSWESYGDAFSWLSELVGFEIVCDEEGLTHFRKQQIPTTPTVSYEFTEGEDVVSLGYTINDSDLYRDIIVHGKKTLVVDEKEVDEVIEFKKVFSAADYWGILPQKILKIDAPEATTLAECEQIALKAEYLMISRARIVRFQSIGIPHIQVGDFIQVTESSSTISEVYRITDLSTNQDSNTYTMDITCHWYSAGGVEE